MELRPPREDDQEVTEIAYQLLRKTIQDHPEIESTLWVSATISSIIDCYEDNGFTADEFIEEWTRIGNHFKDQFPGGRHG